MICAGLKSNSHTRSRFATSYLVAIALTVFGAPALGTPTLGAAQSNAPNAASTEEATSIEETASEGAFSYTAPETCPTEQEFRDFVLVELGYDPWASLSSSIAITIDQQPDNYAGMITADGQEVKRLKHRRCQTLVESLAVIVSVRVRDPEAEAKNARSPDEKDADKDKRARDLEIPKELADESPIKKSPDNDPKPITQPVRVGLRLAAGVDYLTFANVAPGADLEVIFTQPLWEVFVGGGAIFPTRHDFGPGEVESWQVRAQFGGCLLISFLGVCAVGHAGANSAQGVSTSPGLAGIETVTGFFSLGLRLKAALPLAENWRLSIIGEGLMHTIRLGLENNAAGGGVVWHQPPVTAMTKLGITWIH